MPPGRFFASRTTRSVANAFHRAGKYDACSPAAETTAVSMAAMPLGSLIRSFLISFVSSKPILLNPTLSLLSTLSKKDSMAVLSVDRNPLLRVALKYTFFKQFCAGETGLETLQTMRHLLKMGFGGTILTYGKETIFDHRTGTSHGLGTDSNPGNEAVPTEICPNLDAWRAGTLKTISLLGPSDHLAIKYVQASRKCLRCSP